MNSEVIQISLGHSSRLRASSLRGLDAAAAIVTLLLHVSVLIVLLSPALVIRSGGHPQAQLPAMLVSLLPEQAPMPVPASPVEPPRDLRPVVPLPTPVPAHRPVTHPAPAKPATRPAASAASTAPSSSRASNDEQELEDVVGRIRDNWLEPPGVGSSFRCRLRLDYAAGGRIIAVHFLQGCGGGPALDDSVKRAIWKTGLLGDKRDAGSLEIEFTP
ncbi:MAG: TonB C-terminal domain-containing protein [Stenotrophobium sp.]